MVTYRLSTLMVPTRVSLALPLTLGIVPDGSRNPAIRHFLAEDGCMNANVP